MTPELVLYDHPDSTNALKVRLLLAELGLGARRVEIPLRGERPPGYAELHPFGLVPTLVDEEVVVTESNTALRYLAERSGRPDLRGADPRERARIDTMLDSLSLEVRPVLWAVEELVLYDAKVGEDESAGRVTALETALAAYDRLLHPDGPHADGRTFTIADCAIAGRLLHLDALPVDRAVAPRLRRALQAARARPALARSTARRGASDA